MGPEKHRTCFAPSAFVTSSMSLVPYDAPTGPSGSRKRPATVLDEDLYVDAVSDIIKRDFFPELDALRYKNRYLDAAARGDIAGVREATFGLAQLTGARAPAVERTPLSAEMLQGSTPEVRRLDTPGSASRAPWETDDAFSEAPEEQIVDTSLRLDSFQAKYTSEDNASFESVLERQNEARKEKYSWAFDAEKKQLVLKDAADEDRPAGNLLEGAPSSSDSAGNPSGGELVLASQVSDSVAPGEFKPRKFWKHTAQNQLFYPPPGIEGESLLSDKGPDKVISLGNTRFPKTVEAVAAEDKEKERTKQVWQAMAAATPGLFATGGATPSGSGATPRIGGHSLVPSTPTLNPGADVDPLLTWGEIESTPLLISGEGWEDRGPSFKLPPTPRRDLLGHEMGRSAAKSLRERVAGKSSTPVIRKGGATPGSATPADRARLLSPAAKQFLAKSKLGTPMLSAMQRASSPFGDTPRSARMAPTPTVGRAVPQGRSGSSTGRAHTTSKSAADSSSLTEDLLDLGRR